MARLAVCNVDQGGHREDPENPPLKRPIMFLMFGLAWILTWVFAISRFFGDLKERKKKREGKVASDRDVPDGVLV